MVWMASDSPPRQLPSRERRFYSCWVCVLWVMNSVAVGEVTRGNERRDRQKKREGRVSRQIVLLNHAPQDFLISHSQLHPLPPTQHDDLLQWTHYSPTAWWLRPMRICENEHT